MMSEGDLNPRERHERGEVNPPTFRAQKSGVQTPLVTLSTPEVDVTVRRPRL